MFSLLQNDCDQSPEEELIKRLKKLMKNQRKQNKAGAIKAEATAAASAIPAMPVKKTLDMLPRDIYDNVFAELRTPGEKIIAPQPNRTVGPYRNVADYLFTHMHLLRTDFFAYLQHGIQQLRQPAPAAAAVSLGAAGDEDATVVEDVNANTVFWRFNNKKIELQCMHGTHIRHIVRLSPDEVLLVKRVEECKKRGSKEENYVPFMIGSLLLFTTSVQLDDLVLATVVQLDIDHKLVHIQLVRAYKPSSFYERPLIMLECKPFFEPHYQVHRTLGAITNATFPLAEQLIDVSRKPMPPAYLAGDEMAIYCTPDGKHALPLDPAVGPWPSHEELGYNPSQVAAIRHALTHRVAMIQGPPGTGKSFVGRELVGLLLYNTDHRIVIVCNSNQALDQFLDGLIGTYCCNSAASKVVRMGSQCKEPRLQSIVKQQWVPSTQGVSAELMKAAYVAISQCNAKVEVSLRDAALGKCRKALNDRLDFGAAERQRLDKLRQMNDFTQIEDKRVIGMTSSYAAKHGYFLQLLKAPIVIVEEAAELLEAHVVAVLNEHTQHLIQIGDHEQLRPSTFWHTSGVESHMNISLFERLHNNKLPAVALSQQHRMHPVIAELIRPSIYEDLTDAPNVFDYPPVRGMPSRLMFMDHRFPECAVGTSKSNPKEAQLVQKMCAYLLQQGYEPDDITVLCTYRAQVKRLQTDRRSGRCHGCRIEVVDGFQGRESRIVLVSLVRNNAHGRVGYMEAANRACVALSRAREGLFMFGNLPLLADRSPAWAHVQQHLQTVEYGIGDCVLTLRCDLHGNSAEIREPSDFDQAFECGCGMPQQLNNSAWSTDR